MRAVVLIAVVAVGCGGSAIAGSLGTGFTFQAELAQDGVPLTGTVHLRFSLWDAAGAGLPPVGGTQVGASQLLTDVPVDLGVFTVVLNGSGQFGASAFNGERRWIQVEACNDQACGSSTVLGPRQEVPGAPHALVAARPWEIAGADVSYGGGKVAIGLATPASRLHVAAGYTGDGVRLTGGTGASPAYHLYDGALSRASLALVTSPGLWSTDALGGDIVLRTSSASGGLLLQNGFLGSALAIRGNNVGLGTAAPAARLDVRGDIRLGPNGQYFAPGNEENLRLMRGEVASDGSAPRGCCFSASRLATGKYLVTYAIHFDGGHDTSVVVTPTTGDVTATLWLAAPSLFEVWLYDGDGDLVNSGFTFIAAGQR